jgi:hypothetical protein
MLGADPMMSADQPGFDVAEQSVDDREEFGGIGAVVLDHRFAGEVVGWDRLVQGSLPAFNPGFVVAERRQARRNQKGNLRWRCTNGEPTPRCSHFVVLASRTGGFPRSVMRAGNLSRAAKTLSCWHK